VIVGARLLDRLTVLSEVATFARPTMVLMPRRSASHGARCDLGPRVRESRERLGRLIGLLSRKIPKHLAALVTSWVLREPRPTNHFSLLTSHVSQPAFSPRVFTPQNLSRPRIGHHQCKKRANGLALIVT
jgi:hypothetical protein